MIVHIQLHVVRLQGVDAPAGSKGDTGESGKSVSCCIMQPVSLPHSEDHHA